MDWGWIALGLGIIVLAGALALLVLGGWGR
jgi:hypothetical protein